MKQEYAEFLEKMARAEGMHDLSKKQAFLNPLENDMYARLLSGALKGLEAVSLATFDFKLTAIVKLFQVWLSDKRKELEKAKHETQYGAGSWEDSNDPYNPSNFTLY